MSLERADFLLGSENPNQNTWIWGSGQFGVTTEALGGGGVHPSSLLFLLPLSPSLHFQDKTKPLCPSLQLSPPQTGHPQDGAAPPWHPRGTASLGMRCCGIPRASLGTRGVAGDALGPGTPVDLGLSGGEEPPEGFLSWEVTPWILGGVTSPGRSPHGFWEVSPHLGGHPMDFGRCHLSWEVTPWILGGVTSPGRCPRGFGVVWRRGALCDGSNLTWEVTLWIWGCLEDEETLGEVVTSPGRCLHGFGGHLDKRNPLRNGRPHLGSCRKNFTTSSTGLEVSTPHQTLPPPVPPLGTPLGLR
ncbi:uncharacterized protein LOC131095223 [Melospiza georgiana]|uniref:uncharacterized protein LOC131095223 n=1 Tax=Melospiza georgiana TaxID=44398 RepID=UPI0025AD78E1|nr:uncharacterized protein LOC131095223 [Melospiza georgiana]